MQQIIITCIHRGKKDCDLIKNWRPISLIGVIFKLASSAIKKKNKIIFEKYL